MTSTEIELHRNGQVAVPEQHDTDSWVTICSDVIKLANVIHDTEFVPDGLRGSAPAVAAAILAGREMGIGPMTSLQNIHVIKGKPTQSALLMRALVQSRGHKWEDVDVSDIRAVVRGCRQGESKWAEVTFTAEQAKKAGIDLGKYPQDKLYARASARLCRRKFADVVAGMPYTPDEIMDGEEDADHAGTVAEVAEAAASNGHAGKPAPRTAQRRTRANPAPAAPTPAPAASGPQASTDGPPLPPLPGEDEVPTSGAGDTSATGRESGGQSSAPSGDDRATPGWVGLIVKHFERLKVEDRDVRLGYTAQIAGRDSLASTKDLTPDEAKAVLDTLARCKNEERLIAVLDAQERAEHAQDAHEGGSDE